MQSLRSPRTAFQGWRESRGKSEQSPDVVPCSHWSHSFLSHWSHSFLAEVSCTSSGAQHHPKAMQCLVSHCSLLQRSTQCFHQMPTQQCSRLRMACRAKQCYRGLALHTNSSLLAREPRVHCISCPDACHNLNGLFELPQRLSEEITYFVNISY